MKTSDFYYDLPKELIAQDPLEDRSSSRLLHLSMQDGSFEHRHFTDILDYLHKGDCLVINDTKVIPARLYGHKEETGAVIEILLLKRRENDIWECLVKPGKKAYDKQLTLNDYWQQIGGLVMLPGTNRASDRFVRASFYINAIPQTSNFREAVAGVFSVMRNVSVPLGITTPDQPNISSTRWRTVADQKNKVYYFESTLSPDIFWVDFKSLDFKAGTPIKKLTLTNGEIYAGNTAKDFKDSKPLPFLFGI